MCILPINTRWQHDSTDKIMIIFLCVYVCVDASHTKLFVYFISTLSELKQEKLLNYEILIKNSGKERTFLEFEYNEN